MGRMIDADKLIDDLSDLKRSPWANTPYASDERKLGIREALDMIQSIVRVDSQTVDAVPVIRCKDCKHQKKHFHTDGRRKGGGYYIYWCELAEEYSHVCLDDDFCSRAERKEG